MTEAELMDGVRRGEGRAFEALYRRHKDAVYAFACSLCGRTQEADDLVQEAFVGLIRRAGHIHGSSPVGPYLLRSVRNRFADRKRRRSSRDRPLGEAAEEVSRGVGPAEKVSRAERSGRVRRAIDALPASQGDVVRLRVYGRLEFAAIARLMAAPVPTVRWRYRTALEKLRTALCGEVRDVGS